MLIIPKTAMFEQRKDIFEKNIENKQYLTQKENKHKRPKLLGLDVSDEELNEYLEAMTQYKGHMLNSYKSMELNEERFKQDILDVFFDEKTQQEYKLILDKMIKQAFEISDSYQAYNIYHVFVELLPIFNCFLRYLEIKNIKKDIETVRGYYTV